MPRRSECLRYEENDRGVPALTGPGLGLVYAAIETLPDKYKMPLVLFAIGGRDIKEIASDLQLKGATVKTRLFCAREKLREHLTGDQTAAPNT